MVEAGDTRAPAARARRSHGSREAPTMMSSLEGNHSWTVRGTFLVRAPPSRAHSEILNPANPGKGCPMRRVLITFAVLATLALPATARADQPIVTTQHV